MRRADWPERLAALIATWEHRPFAWGQSDCALFAHAVLAAQRREDWSAMALPRYADARSARRVLKRLKCADVTALADLLLGGRLAPVMAHRGDIVSLPTPHGPALGVCLGAQAAAPGPDGLTRMNMTQALACWRV